MLVESILTNLNFSWKWLFSNSFIFETKASGWNMVISDKVWDYFNEIDWICSNFYGLGMHCYQYNLYGYQNKNTLTVLNCIIWIMSLSMHETRIMILMLDYHFVFTSANRNSYFVMSDDYGLFFNVQCENVIDTICKHNLLNTKCIFYSTYNSWCRIRWNKKDRKYKITDNTIGDLNIDYLLMFADNCNFVITNDHCMINYRYFINIYLILQLHNHISDTNQISIYNYQKRR